MKDEFQEFWQANFPECPPVSYILKHNLPERWFRIHSLPESKRYAENPEEVKDILQRQRILFEDIIGKKEECFIVCGGFGESPRKIYAKKLSYLTKIVTFDSEPILRKTFEKDAEADEIFQIAFGKRKVKFQNLQKIFIAVANWEIAYFFLLNLTSKRIFAPYDGGVDIISENSAKRDEFKAKYKNWLSSRSDGF